MSKKIIQNLHQKLPGRTIRENYFQRAIPPLWIWLRSSFFVLCGLFLILIGFDNIATILFTFAVIQLVGVSLAFFFQELAKGIHRYKDAKSKKDDD